MSNLGFSYAQAAKGLAPSSNPSSSNPTSSASSDHGSRDASALSDAVAATLKSPRNNAKLDKDITSTPKSSHAVIPSDEEPTMTEKSATLPENPVTDKSPTTTQSPVQDEVRGNMSPPGSRISESAATTEAQKEKLQQLGDVGDTQEKNKDTDDDWEKVSIPSVAAEKLEKELKAAPIPAVNFWQQRSLAHQAKQKDHMPQSKPAPTISQQPKPKAQPAASDDNRRKPSARDISTSETVTAGRGNTGGRSSKDQQNTQSSPRSTPQQNDQPAQPPPPVDAESWPTPESAGVDSGRRSSTVERSEKVDLTDTKNQSRKNQWTAMPFVPSVKFETQIPSARRGGRPSNTRGRGGANAQSDRSTEKNEPGSMGPPPLPKQATDQDRGRKNNPPRPTRASSVPTENPRAGTTERQSEASFAARTSKEPASAVAVPSGASKEQSPGTETPPTQGPSRSSSRHAPVSSKSKGQKVDSEVPIVRNAELTESPSRQPTQGEHHKTSTNDVPKSGNDSGDKSQSKEWPKDRPANAQKGENWRNRGERAERGRGNYRGRGNHTSFNNPSFTSPLPQAGFDSPKQSNPGEPRSRQPSQPYTTPFGSTRNNPRSQSVPVHILQSRFFQPGPSFQQNLPPLQTDLNFGGYGQMPTGMPSSIMTAMPYNDQLNGFALISMVATQLEYYFSLDNLCKDMYLRKNMDSQGYVPLRVIAEFRRIKALLGDSSMSYEQLKNVAQQVRNIEYVTGEDGEDRLRSRENWKDFVLPIEERLPQAQNDGSKIRSTYPRHSTGMMADFQTTNGLRSAPPVVNGFHDTLVNQPYEPGSSADPLSAGQWASRVESDRQEDERRTSITSPLSKIQSPNQEPKALFGSMTNGHRDSVSSNSTAKENTFPDEEVAKLKVVVKDPDYQGDDKTSTTEEPVPARVSGLRGGAGSPEQFERIRGLQFGQNVTTPIKSTEQMIYFTHGGEAPPHYLRPGYIHEEYLVLREQALNQRADNHFDGACVPLYPLWAEFLTAPGQFNIGMYEDFKTWAIEDEEKGNSNGKKHLVKFYDAMLKAKSPMTERLATDIVNISRTEPEDNTRPVWLRLRAAWRDGATNMKTRKRLTELLTSEEQAELERRT